MSFNRTLVSLTGGVVAGLGAQKVYLYQLLPASCISAIENNLSDAQITLACPPEFNNIGLLILLVAGGFVFLLSNNWMVDIFRGAKDMLDSSKST